VGYRDFQRNDSASHRCNHIRAHQLLPVERAVLCRTNVPHDAFCRYCASKHLDHLGEENECARHGHCCENGQEPPSAFSGCFVSYRHRGLAHRSRAPAHDCSHVWLFCGHVFPLLRQSAVENQHPHDGHRRTDHRALSCLWLLGRAACAALAARHMEQNLPQETHSRSGAWRGRRGFFADCLSVVAPARLRSVVRMTARRQQRCGKNKSFQSEQAKPLNCKRPSRRHSAQEGVTTVLTFQDYEWPKHANATFISFINAVWFHSFDEELRQRWKKSRRF